MILIPEIEVVLLLVPRTGSGSLKRAVAARYPKSTLLYRHMEADGVPAGYDRWQRIGVVRNPLYRLCSLYKFLQKRGGETDTKRAYPDHFDAMARSVDRPFEDWLLHNEAVFTSPYDSANQGRFYPQFMVRHALPENRKSQFIYLRPDLGTTIYLFHQITLLAATLGVDLGRHNATEDSPIPRLSAEGKAYMERVFAWDYAQAEGGA